MQDARAARPQAGLVSVLGGGLAGAGQGWLDRQVHQQLYARQQQQQAQQQQAQQQQAQQQQQARAALAQALSGTLAGGRPTATQLSQALTTPGLDPTQYVALVSKLAGALPTPTPAPAQYQTVRNPFGRGAIYQRNQSTGQLRQLAGAPPPGSAGPGTPAPDQLNAALATAAARMQAGTPARDVFTQLTSQFPGVDAGALLQQLGRIEQLGPPAAPATPAPDQDQAADIALLEQMGQPGATPLSAVQAVVRRYTQADVGRLLDLGQDIQDTQAEMDRRGTMSPDERDAVMDLHRRFQADPRVGEYRNAGANARKMSSMLRDPAGAHDVALLFLFGKLLDPDSVVRESEYRAFAGAAPKIEAIPRLLARVQTGEQLLPEQRADMVDVADRLQAAYREMMTEAVGDYWGHAGDIGLSDPALVIPRFAREFIPQQTVPGQPPAWGGAQGPATGPLSPAEQARLRELEAKAAAEQQP